MKFKSKSVFNTGIQTLTLLLLLLFSGNSTFGQSIEIDKELGAKNAKAVAEQMGIYNDPELTAYVAKVGNRLVAKLENNPFEFRFYVADDPSPNAFALPGGYLYVTRGLLALINTEDELATIMGHEIIHAYRRHSIKQAKKSILPKILELPGNIVGAVVSDDLGNLINAPIKAGNELFLANYSRKHEKESDKMGVALAAKAGYNPEALGPLLTRLAAVIEELTGSEENRSYFSDHPFTPDRVAKIDKELEKISWTETEKVSSEFPTEINRLTFGKNPARGIFVDDKFLHPGLKLAITFPQKWQTANEYNSIGAAQEDGNSAILLNLIEEDKPPKELGETFINNWQQHYRQQPTKSGPYTVGNTQGYRVIYSLEAQDGVFILNILWFIMHNQYYQMVGITPESEVALFDKTAGSIHSITEEEIGNIKIYKIAVVTTKNEESLESVSASSNNIIKLSLISLMNDVKTTDTLDSGKKIKIVVEEKFKK